MKVYATLKAWKRSNCRNVLWLANDRRCRLFSVYPTNTQNENSAMYTVFKNNLCSRKPVI